MGMNSPGNGEPGFVSPTMLVTGAHPMSVVMPWNTRMPSGRAQNAVIAKPTTHDEITVLGPFLLNNSDSETTTTIIVVTMCVIAVNARMIPAHGPNRLPTRVSRVTIPR